MINIIVNKNVKLNLNEILSMLEDKKSVMWMFTFFNSHFTRHISLHNLQLF